MSKLITLTSPVYNSFHVGLKPILSTNLFRQFAPSQMQVLPDICAEMCRPSSTTLAVHFPASMEPPSSFCDWKKRRKVLAPSPAIFPSVGGGRSLVLQMFSPVYYWLLTPSSPRWRRAYHSVMGCALIAPLCIPGLLCAFPVISFVSRCIFGAVLQIFS